jgi:hypothetical protein
MATEADTIERAVLLGMIAGRALELHRLEQTLASTEDDLLEERLDARIDELNRIAEMVARWGIDAPVAGGDGDGR